MKDDLVDESAPPCPHCRRPMDLVVSSWWCLECQEHVDGPDGPLVPALSTGLLG
ncbi:hypothetical protein [Naasia sp.]|uniref:hypothetical protein n=1 Tax=Naasia sp. TaxID=2546198 RepID=UPI002622BCFF|nr:hypothetical protein [Naasia sp.]